MLLNPHLPTGRHSDEETREILAETIRFFEERGKTRLKQAFNDQEWYSDFLDFVKEKRLYSRVLTPAGLGPQGARWDTWRICEFGEVLAFYGLEYWYSWQVTVLGLGPLWMTSNEALRRRAAELLDQGGIFAFGLSEKEHGADIYSTEMALTPAPGGGFLANGSKYYIGNGNAAAMVSIFGRVAGTDEYVFFPVDPQHECYHLKKNIVASQSYVAEFELKDYPVAESDLLSRGQEAWDAALNTVNIGKFNLGWGSVGICTHAFYEALDHAANRRLYNRPVTDFPHVRRMLVDAWTRLAAMRVFASRASDYMRSASREDRRYLLYNPMVKMKVTTQGEEVIDLLWDVIAAKGFEKDTYFREASAAIRALPKLEGTVHVNIALIVKFMANYFFRPAPYPDVPRRDDPADDAFLFDQGSTGGLGDITFHDYHPAYEGWDLPNVRIFAEQVETFRRLLAEAPPDGPQRRDVDFLLSLGQLFALAVYAQLFLEGARLEEVEPDVVDQVFDFMVRDASRYAVELHGRAAATDRQAELCMGIVRRPAHDPERYGRIWAGRVLPLAGAYRMNP